MTAFDEAGIRERDALIHDAIIPDRYGSGCQDRRALLTALDASQARLKEAVDAFTKIATCACQAFCAIPSITFAGEPPPKLCVTCIARAWLAANTKG
jgi:hypothetical protein